MEDIIEKSEKEMPVAGVIVEAIQCEGGDRHASPDFFHDLQALVKKVIACYSTLIFIKRAISV